MQEVKRSGCKNLIIDCSYDILASVLEQAQQVGVMSERHNVIVASLVRRTMLSHFVRLDAISVRQNDESTIESGMLEIISAINSQEIKKSLVIMQTVFNSPS